MITVTAVAVQNAAQVASKESVFGRERIVAGGARRLVEGYVKHYNDVRLNSAIGYITPKDMLAARQQQIRAERDGKLGEARKQRQARRQHAA